MIASPSALHVATEVLAWTAGRRTRMRVAGPSMEPTLRNGEHVLVDIGSRPEPRDLVVAAPPGDRGLDVVKRVERRSADGGYWLISDNPEQGVDSRAWGLIPPERIKGVVTVNLNRPGAALAPRQPRHWATWLRR